MIDLSGKTALVTGAGAGIGLGIASVLAATGARVAVTDIDLDAAEGAAARIGRGAFALQGDISDADSVDRMVSGVEARSPIDLLVNNAGVGQPLVSIARLDPLEWQRVIDVNVRGTYLASRAAYLRMRLRGAGSIVNVASITGLAGFPGSHAYGVSKAAVVMLTQTLAGEFARYGIRVNAVAPGLVDAPMLDLMTAGGRLPDILARVPLGRLATPNDIGNSVAFLCSDLASYITGAILPVDGGWLAFGGAGGAPRGRSEATNHQEELSHPLD